MSSSNKARTSHKSKPISKEVYEYLSENLLKDTTALIKEINAFFTDKVKIAIPMWIKYDDENHKFKHILETFVRNNSIGLIRSMKGSLVGIKHYRKQIYTDKADLRYRDCETFSQHIADLITIFLQMYHLKQYDTRNVLKFSLTIYNKHCDEIAKSNPHLRSKHNYFQPRINLDPSSVDELPEYFSSSTSTSSSYMIQIYTKEYSLFSSETPLLDLSSML